MNEEFKNEIWTMRDGTEIKVGDMTEDHQVLADLRRRHGDAVKVVHDNASGMGGADIYIYGEWYGWYGGI